MAERYSDITETYLSYLEKGWNNSTKLLFFVSLIRLDKDFMNKEYYPNNDYSYNADDVSFRMQHLRMADFIAMVDNHKLDLFENDTELSKYLNAWSNKRKVFLSNL